jgi:hypothetical protein
MAPTVATDRPQTELPATQEAHVAVIHSKQVTHLIWPITNPQCCKQVILAPSNTGLPHANMQCSCASTLLGWQRVQYLHMYAGWGTSHAARAGRRCAPTLKHMQSFTMVGERATDMYFGRVPAVRLATCLKYMPRCTPSPSPLPTCTAAMAGTNLAWRSRMALLLEHSCWGPRG